ADHVVDGVVLDQHAAVQIGRGSGRIGDEGAGVGDDDAVAAHGGGACRGDDVAGDRYGDAADRSPVAGDGEDLDAVVADIGDRIGADRNPAVGEADADAVARSQGAVEAGDRNGRHVGIV